MRQADRPGVGAVPAARREDDAIVVPEHRAIVQAEVKAAEDVECSCGSKRAGGHVQDPPVGVLVEGAVEVARAAKQDLASIGGPGGIPRVGETGRETARRSTGGRREPKLPGGGGMIAGLTSPVGDP